MQPPDKPPLRPPFTVPKTQPLTPNMPPIRGLPGRASNLTAAEKAFCRLIMPDVNKFKTAGEVDQYFSSDNLLKLYPTYFGKGDDSRRHYMMALAGVTHQAANQLWPRRHAMAPMTQVLKDKIAKAIEVNTHKTVADAMLKSLGERILGKLEANSKSVEEGARADAEFDTGVRYVRRAVEMLKFVDHSDEVEDVLNALETALRCFANARELYFLGEDVSDAGSP